jgi:DNA primase
MLTYNEIDSQLSVVSLLRECGATKIQDKGSYISFSSPFHEDKNPSMVLYKENLFCVDFSRGYRKSLFTFVWDTLQQNLFSLLGITKKESIEKNFFIEEAHNKRKFLEMKKTDSYKMFIKGDRIKYDFSLNRKAHEYSNKRFLTKEFIDYFQIGYSDVSYIYRAPDVKESETLKGTIFQDRICIPIIENNEIISIEGRDFTGKNSKKVIYPRGGKTSTLFNIDNLSHKDPLVIVEGVMDTPRIWEHITKNVTTVFGITLSKRQKDLLKEFDDIILFPDTDKAGRLLVSTFDQFYEKPFRVAFLQEHDPGNPLVSLHQIEKAISQSKESTEFFLDESELFEKTDMESSFFSL